MCTDCHDPHPNSSVQPLVDINHTSIQRAKRLPMSVDDPNVCYKCHQAVFALTQLPSHHPIREGKMRVLGLPRSAWPGRTPTERRDA